eukprot:187730_1
MSQEAKLTSAYTILFLFFIATFVLLSTILHLVYVAHQKNKNKSRSNRCNNKQILFIIIITLFGIISFFISVVLMIVLIIQILLIDGHELDKDRRTSFIGKFYYESFDETETLIVIFDELGHLAMLTVFIIRLKVCFANSVYGFSNSFMRFMYCCLILLIIASFIIIMQIVNNSNIEIVIISQIIWEILIECMCLWILYLFVSKLQALVKMGLNSRKNLRLTISYNISQKSRSKEENSKRNSLRINSSIRSPSPSPSIRSPSPSPKPLQKQLPKPNQTVLNNQGLVNVMTKMTLLVLLSVVGSFISLIGNIYIEIYELQETKKINIKQETNVANIQHMWIWLLPVCDMILTSFMLYLQFDFTKEIYAKLCTKCDIMFIQFCGDLLSKNVSNNISNNKTINKQIKIQSTTHTNKLSQTINKTQLPSPKPSPIPSPNPSPKPSP